MAGDRPRRWQPVRLRQLVHALTSDPKEGCNVAGPQPATLDCSQDIMGIQARREASSNPPMTKERRPHPLAGRPSNAFRVARYRPVTANQAPVGDVTNRMGAKHGRGSMTLAVTIASPAVVAGN